MDDAGVKYVGGSLTGPTREAGMTGPVSLRGEDGHYIMGITWLYEEEPDTGEERKNGFMMQRQLAHAKRMFQFSCIHLTNSHLSMTLTN